MSEIIKQGMGPSGYCICPKCDYKIIHQAGIPCREEKCPRCGTRLVRENSVHYLKIKQKKGGD